MKFNAPSTPVFVISLVLFGLALAGHYASLGAVSENRFWFALAAYASLAIGCLLKGR